MPIHPFRENQPALTIAVERARLSDSRPKQTLAGSEAIQRNVKRSLAIARFPLASRREWDGGTNALGECVGVVVSFARRARTVTILEWLGVARFARRRGGGRWF